MADGNMTPSDYMYYADIDTDGDGLRDYRAVKIDEYRPYWTGYTSSSSNTYQDDNGYTTRNIYYFKFEPIEWRILDPDEGLIMTEKIMDSQAYNNYILDADGAYWGDADKTYYANDYYNSSIRQWLNNDFYNTAFTASQASNIRNDVTLNNDCYSSSYSQYNSQASKDKMFLLSWDESLTPAYGFSSSYSTYDTARQAQGTDYAKSQGLDVRNYSSYEGNSWWWLRSPGRDSIIACSVHYRGHSYDGSVNDTDNGVRPACRLSNLRSDIFQSAIDNNIGSGAEGDCSNGHTPYTENNAVAPTCTEPGLTASTRCSVCGVVLEEQKVLSALTHTDSNNDGKCDRCGAAIEGFNPSANCSHICHKGGIAAFFYKIARFFWKLFKINKECSCGVAHY